MGEGRMGECSQRDCDRARAEGTPSVCRGAASGASPARLDTVLAAALSVPLAIRASTAHVTCESQFRWGSEIDCFFGACRVVPCYCINPRRYLKIKWGRQKKKKKKKKKSPLL